jgi:hypothetical protein
MIKRVEMYVQMGELIFEKWDWWSGDGIYVINEFGFVRFSYTKEYDASFSLGYKINEERIEDLHIDVLFSSVEEMLTHESEIVRKLGRIRLESERKSRG